MNDDSNSKNHLLLLNKGKVVWNSKMAGKPFRPDFRNANLYGRDLSNYDFTNADFRGADLTYAKLSGSIITGANFKNAKLKRNTGHPHTGEDAALKNNNNPKDYFLNEIKLCNFTGRIIFPNGATYERTKIENISQYPHDSSTKIIESLENSDSDNVDGLSAEAGGIQLPGVSIEASAEVTTPTLGVTQSANLSHVKALISNPNFTRLTAALAISQINEAVENYTKETRANELSPELEVLNNIKLVFISIPTILQNSNADKREMELLAQVEALKSQVAELTEKLKLAQSSSMLDKFKDNFAENAGKGAGDWRFWCALTVYLTGAIGFDASEVIEFSKLVFENFDQTIASETQHSEALDQLNITTDK